MGNSGLLLTPAMFFKQAILILNKQAAFTMFVTHVVRNLCILLQMMISFRSLSSKKKLIPIVNNYGGTVAFFLTVVNALLRTARLMSHYVTLNQLELGQLATRAVHNRAAACVAAGGDISEYLLNLLKPSSFSTYHQV